MPQPRVTVSDISLSLAQPLDLRTGLRTPAPEGVDVPVVEPADYPALRRDGVFRNLEPAQMEVLDVFKASLEVQAFEVHCPAQEGATAKFSQETSRSLEAGFELALNDALGAGVTLGASGTFKLTVTGSYTAKNQCVRYVLNVPALWQRVLDRTHAHQGIGEVRLLDVFEGDLDVMVVPITDCTCRTGVRREDTNEDEERVTVFDLTGVDGTFERRMDVEYGGKVSLSVKLPVGPLIKDKPAHEASPKITLSGTKKLGYTYTLPGGTAYVMVTHPGDGHVTWVQP